MIFKLFSSCHFKEDETKSNCFGDNLKHYVLAFAVLNLVFSLAKMFQDKAYLCNINLWRHRTEDLFYIVIFGLVLADYLIEDSGDEEKKIHRIIAAFMVIISCRIMMHTFARNPDVAIVSEMVDHIRSSLLKFFFSAATCPLKNLDLSENSEFYLKIRLIPDDLKSDKSRCLKFT